MTLLFLNKVYKDVADKIISIASYIPAIEPDWLMFGLYNESGLNSTAENEIGCVGYAQFCPDDAGGDYKTIGGRQYKLQDIKLMNPVDQLDLTLQYFKDVQKDKGRFASYHDLLLADFYPDAIGKPDDYVFPAKVVSANPTLFKYGNTLAAYKRGRDERVKEIVPQEYWANFFKKKNLFQLYKKEIIIWTIIIFLLIVIYTFFKKLK